MVDLGIKSLESEAPHTRFFVSGLRVHHDVAARTTGRRQCRSAIERRCGDYSAARHGVGMYGRILVTEQLFNPIIIS